MKILIVEDDVLLSDSLKAILSKKGFETDCVYDGEDGYIYSKTGVYDLIILDVMMPKLNGYKVVENLRKDGVGTPVLMLTAMSEVEDEIHGLNCGADYYLTKPFDSRKLMACIYALLRRQGDQINEMTFGNTSLNLSNSNLTCGDNSVRLSSKEFDILRYLMASKGRIISKESILQKVWGFDSSATDNNVEVYMRLLRKKLGYIGSDISIQTVRSMGYILEVVSNA